jgi:hypothetical protein
VNADARRFEGMFGCRTITTGILHRGAPKSTLFFSAPVFGNGARYRD